ncbi:MAG: MATE family efflux transporter [Saprospiraceae bacterium]|nr:MAG: putative antiporter membrane protein [Bacteroidetes bacterium OLB9]MCO6462974.1 MATE family efflux transporter [Saprospiraceae bacterium]MCZ2336846.1 MATE family efflux transporter [Chitinophagales bacterium]
MELNTSYKQILSLSVPIMLGSAAQNIIVLSDNVFLYHYNSVDFAAAGLVGVFYLIISSIGYGFSRGGQIIIARRYGEKNFTGAGKEFQALVLFELLLAVVLFLFLRFGSHGFFEIFVKDPHILEKCIEYIIPRSWGVFFSYIGLCFIAFYTGIADTKFIVYDTFVLIVVNLVLNYVLVFGKFGFEPMGIAGSATASTIAEIVAFVVFAVYMLFDKSNRKYRLFTLNGPAIKEIVNMFKISIPIVFQSILSIGSWFLFFSFIENIGRQELEISNLLRTVYLILSIPCWGYSTGINTLVSGFIGHKKRQAVIPLIIKTTKLNLATTLLISIPVVLFPEFFLYPLFGKEDMSLIMLSKPYLPMLLLILTVFGIGGIFFNGLIGTGHTQTALRIQTIFTVFYIVCSYVLIKMYYFGLNWAWSIEVFYWVGIAIMSYMYLRTNKWHFLKF